MGIKWIQPSIISCWIVMGLCGLPMVASFATLPYYQHHEQGWHWYQEDEPPQKAPKKVVAVTPKPATPKVTVPPEETLAAVRLLVRRALAKAFLQPTRHNVSAYIALQNRVSNQSARFATTWQEALRYQPALDFSLRHPTNTVALGTYYDLQRQQEEKAILTLKQTSGLFFFYRGDCPYCHQFAPILKHFVTRYHMPIVPISLGAGFLSEFPHSKLDTGQAQRFHVRAWPALFIVNPHTHQAVPVSYGVLSETDLKKRLVDIARQWGGKQA